MTVSRVRFRRPRRRELTPFKAVLVYGLAFLLVIWHQSGRVAEWLENQALAREGRLSETALALALAFKEKVHPYGPAQLNRWEDRLLARLAPELEIGAVLPPAPEPEAMEPAAAPPPETPEEPDQEAAPEAADPAPPQPAAAQPPAFKKVLLLGDSMMLEGLGPQLQKELRRRHENLTVDRDGRYGTGLTRLDHFDWLDFFERMLAKYSPDLVILTIGANDPQDILNPEGAPGRRRIFMGTTDWSETYSARVAELLKSAEDQGVQVFWVGLPIMGRQPYGGRVADINAMVASVCAEAANCRFWDSWLSVADDQGRFSSYGLDENGRRLRLRGRDFIHLTEEGGRVMAQKFLAETEDWADFQGPVDPPDLLAADPPADLPTAALSEAEAAPPPPPLQRPKLKPAAPPPAEPPPAEFDEDTAWPPEDDYDVHLPLPEDDPWFGVLDDGDEFVDPLPVEPQPRPAPSAGDGYEEDQAFEAVWSEGLFYSPALGREIVWRLVQPGPGRPGPFPAIILLHGAWDSAAAWERELGREALLALAGRLGVVLALPEAPSLGWYLDGRETAAATFLTSDFLPLLWRQCPQADRRRLALAGLSMGGHGALTLALKHPELFQAAAALSAITDLAAHTGGHALDERLGLDRALGPAGLEGRNWRPFGAAGLWAAQSSAWGDRPLYLGVGLGDRLTLDENRAFHRQLKDLGLAHVYEEKPGGHDWNYWSAELPGLIEFLAKALS